MLKSKIDLKQKIKENVLDNEVVIALRDRLKKKVEKNLQKEFKTKVLGFLNDPSLSEQSIVTEKLNFEDHVEMTKNILITKKEFEEKLKIVLQNALYQENKITPVKVVPKIKTDSEEEEPKNEFLSNKYGEGNSIPKENTKG